MTTRKFKILCSYITFLLDHDGLQYFRIIPPKDRHDLVGKAVDTDLNAVRSQEGCSVSNAILSSNTTHPVVVPVLVHRTSKCLFNILPHLLKQSLQTEFHSPSSYCYLVSSPKTDKKFAKFSFLTLLNSKWSVCS